MITRKAINEYAIWSGDSLGLADGPWILYRASNEQMYTVPVDETDEIFANRIERSKKAGRNLFYEELPEFKPDPCDLW